MADTSTFDELAGVIDILDSVGIPVVADTHVREDTVDGEPHVVADLTVILDSDQAADFELSDEERIREIVLSEMNRAARMGRRPMGVR